MKKKIIKDIVMRKTIGGKLYDTCTAKELVRRYGGQGGFDEACECLYRKRTGEYFLYGHGAPFSEYGDRSSADCQQWTWGERIVPLTESRAKRWVSEKFGADAYKNIFGEAPADEERKTVKFSLPLSTLDKIRRMASEKNMTISDLIVWMMDDYS